jgi:hypothetical protein
MPLGERRERIVLCATNLVLVGLVFVATRREVVLVGEETIVERVVAQLVNGTFPSARLISLALTVSAQSTDIPFSPR